MSSPEGSTKRRVPNRSRSNFLTRSATDDAEQLARRTSLAPSATTDSPSERRPSQTIPQYRDSIATHGSQGGSQGGNGWFSRMFSGVGSGQNLKSKRRRSLAGLDSTTTPLFTNGARKSRAEKNGVSKPRPGAFPRPVGGSFKLGTFAGVFVPTTLNVLSILMFLRFGFILGQSGVLGMLGMLVACYAINLLTTMSISAIATNGMVRGGGAYYLISRSLGPEFGGSIGLVFYLGFVFNTGMNAVGLIDCFIENFGSENGNWQQWLPEGFWWQYIWATIVLVTCTVICLAGSGLFARCSNGLLAVLLVATFSIPFSTLVVSPFESRKLGVQYTGLSLETLSSNLLPRFTRGAAGSQIKQRESFQDLFGILFPATGGIFAGASMSGDLKHPSKAIPKGTLYGLALTFFSYAIVILSMGASITRASLYRNTNVIQLVNMSEIIILLGEVATSLFSVLMGVIGSAKLLQAIARDNLVPGISIFGQGTKGTDEPTFAIFITYAIAQLTMLSDINTIAIFVTMAYLMTFLVTNLACFLLKISSAPNFRPSFHFFNWQTAFVGAAASGATMFFVDGVSASGSIVLLLSLFLIIHYTTPPKPWGDVSQSLIYHQVRKYLLRLRLEHVKFWRPQILLFINDPRRQYRLIQFCNSLKKGSLFILGHVIVTDDFGGSVPEARRQQASWTNYIDFSKIKAFVNIAISPALEWGARNIVLSAGLGGMRPNIVVMGFYNLHELRIARPLVDVPSPQSPQSVNSAGESRLHAALARRRRKRSLDDKMHGKLPTDAMRKESAASAQSYLTILEDLLLRLQVNVAIAKGFQDLDLPAPAPSKSRNVMSMFNFCKGAENEEEDEPQKYIDLWPIQMSGEIQEYPISDEYSRNVLTTNFDTYTLILQLGCILNTVPSWKRTYKVRIAVFVEYESDVEEEKTRVASLLTNLRIKAEIRLFWLASGSLSTYEFIVNGKAEESESEVANEIDEVLKEEEWWHDMKKRRDRSGPVSAAESLMEVEGLIESASNWPQSSFQHGRAERKTFRFEGLRKMLHKSKRKTSMSNLSQLGVSMGMRTHKLSKEMVEAQDSASEVSTDESDSSVLETESENDAEDFYDSDELPSRPVTPARRTHSLGSSSNPSSFLRRFPRNIFQSTHSSSAPNLNILTKRFDDITSNEATTHGTQSKPSIEQSEQPSPGTTPPKLVRPPTMRQQSHQKFSSKITPRTTLAQEDGPGPSIMFTDQPSPDRDISSNPHRSIYNQKSRRRASGSNQASGFPFQQSLPLCFNDLPCRAQHLILNELIRKESMDTAVILTTLPSPRLGTCNSEEDSVQYLSDLEVLCQGLPPVLLVHSNSMTVTTNL